MKNLEVLWIVEKPSSQPGIAEVLMGNYAVRVIASPCRLLQILSLRQSYCPSLVLLNLERIYESVEDLTKNLISKNIPFMEIGSNQAGGAPDDALLLAMVAKRLLATTSSSFYSRTFKDIAFCLKNHQLTTLSGTRSLAKKESRILEVLLVQPGRCVSREELQRAVWPETKVGPRTIDCHVSRLRKHLEETEVEIQSSYGGGYIIA